jgi:predicted O-methyltransferase YrrM
MDLTEKKNVLEIGFNSGFSALLMLESNPHIYLTCVDIGEHKYTMPCFEKIKKKYEDRIQIIIGNSVQTLPKITEKFDFIHIDGAHDSQVATSDIIHSFHLSKHNTILIFDDYWGELKKLWDFYSNSFNLQNVPTPYDSSVGSSPHDIKMVIKE